MGFLLDCRIFGVIYQVASVALHSKMYLCRVAIAEFFRRFSPTADDVSNFAFEISGQGRDPAEVAREWIEANPERVDAWLGL